MAGYFDMDVQATRFNWYRDSSEWKPFHHDAAALKEKFARTQNFTLAVSFGAEREAAGGSQESGPAEAEQGSGDNSTGRGKISLFYCLSCPGLSWSLLGRVVIEH